MQFLPAIAILCVGIVLMSEIDHARGALLTCVIQDDPNQTVRNTHECPDECVHSVSGACALVAGCQAETLAALCGPGTVPKYPDKPVYRFHAGGEKNPYARRQYYDY